MRPFTRLRCYRVVAKSPHVIRFEVQVEKPLPMTAFNHGYGWNSIAGRLRKWLYHRGYRNWRLLGERDETRNTKIWTIEVYK